MSPVLRNILAVIAGVVIGSIVNMGIIMISSSLIPPPEGVDVADMDSLKASMHLFQPKHYLMPFLAHALGTLVGAFVAAKLAASYPFRFAMGIAIWFLFGGLVNVFLLPVPTWFVVLDLVVAYLPMGWLGAKLAGVNPQ